ncbi:LysR family transcriptional regulator [Comamonas piscis]|jgi:DNA-binding transcriptional LysR family regulator|uniref:LysR family transcriptional regulator n=1 Tax=Comamonas piscis TaxID=1562974 RepID=A0A7G5EH38_9BURK|nr:LysR family transcriptional regulator [Comamonas piscis]QMV73313.1 LysR family transcriptional regulator [Comamonas piscis]WSO36113.1 LysR family transcriptional regulator [Comamonas piscis]
MDLRHIRYFVAVATTRNFTRAAEQMHIAQPPFSRQIQQLEDELGVQLIQRNSRPVRLTEAGRLFYEQSLQVLQRVDQMKSAARQVGLNQRQSISIAYVASTLYGGLPMLVRMFRKRYPDTDVHLVDMGSIQQIQELRSGRIDLGFGRIRTNDTSVARTVLREEKLVLAIAPGTPLAADTGRIRLPELAGQRLIVYPKDPRPSFADHVLGLLHDQGIQPAEVHEVRELQAGLGLVAAEMGVCIVPAAARLRSDLVYRLIDDERATSPIILSHRVNDDSWYIAAIKELTAEMYAQNPPWLDFETNAFPAGEMYGLVGKR